jgi:predicted solute-binding protein
MWLFSFTGIGYSSSWGTLILSMAQFRVGCVPYVNARPLVAAFDHPNEFVEVLYEVPSKLPAMLDSGQVDAILVSSIELLRRDDLAAVAEVGIMSYGPVLSVRLLSKVPLEEIKTLALDQSSMTSNLLAQVILAEKGVFPSTEVQPPNAPDMLANHDACVIIGDRGFEADGTGLVDIDLGEAWTNMTGLPFVWALWLGKQNAPMDVRKLWSILFLAYQASGFDALHTQLDRENRPDVRKIENPQRTESMEEWSQANEPRRRYIIQSTLSRCNWTEQQIEHYLTHGVRYCAPKAIAGLKTFRELIEKHRLAKVCQPQPTYDDLKLEIFKLIPVE